MKPPVVTITNFCLNHAGYFDWLVTGFGLLQERGQLRLRFRLPASKTALRHRYFRWGAKAIAPGWVAKINGPMWWLEAEIDFGGKVSKFVFDVTDHGYAYAESLLPSCDRYFKCQLPTSFPAPLQLCKGISRPMPQALIDQADKVKPAMLGRPLSRALDFSKNLRLLREWESKATAQKSTRLFAYFGGDSDPEADNRLKDFPGLYQHPNPKRGRLVAYLRGLEHSGVDARLVNSSDPSLIGPALADDDSYSRTVASSAYNLNVSGLSLSLPFRFIDSFLVGTAVATDSLAIHWYAPFDPEEVIELGPMGYELDQDVDWQRAEARLKELADSSPAHDAARTAHLLDRYQRLWSPEALARYVLASCEESL